MCCYLCEKLSIVIADAIDAEFNQTPNKHHFQNYFRALFKEHVSTGKYGEKRNAEFLRLIQQHNIQLPSMEKLSGSNTFKDPTDLYFTIFQTNICYHAYRRMKAFCLHITENNDWPRARDTLDFLFKEDSDKVPDPHIITAIQQHLQPINFADGGRAYFYEKHINWYRYMPLFFRLQRYIRQ